MTAFGFGLEFRRQFTFHIAITRTTSMSRAERAELAVDTLRDFKVPKAVVSAARKHMDKALGETVTEEAVVNEGGATV